MECSKVYGYVEFIDSSPDSESADSQPSAAESVNLQSEFAAPDAESAKLQSESASSSADLTESPSKFPPLPADFAEFRCLRRRSCSIARCGSHPSERNAAVTSIHSSESSKSESETASQSDSQSDSQTDSQTESQSDSQSESETDSQTESQTDSQSESETESQSQSESQSSASGRDSESGELQLHEPSPPSRALTAAAPLSFPFSFSFSSSWALSLSWPDLPDFAIRCLALPPARPLSARVWERAAYFSPSRSSCAR